MALVLTITAAGRAALVNAQNTGTAPVTIARVGISPQALAPTAATAALPGEIKRIATLSGDVVADDTIHLIVRDESSDIYAIRSFALYLGDGTLFAAYGQADPIMEKSAQSLLLLAIDVRFVDVAAPDLTFGDATFINPPATVERLGVVELATDAEATDGTDPVRAVTPRGAKAAVTAWLKSRFGDGAPSAFIKGLLLSASAVAFRASLAIKSAALKDEGAGNGLDADLLDGQHGAWYADIPARLGYTPWHLNNDGAGSGLDADLLDGKEGAAYALLAGAAFTGDLTSSASVGIRRAVVAGYSLAIGGATQGGLYITPGADAAPGAPAVNIARGAVEMVMGATSAGANAFIGTCGAHDFLIYRGSAERLRATATGVDVTGAVTSTTDFTAGIQKGFYSRNSGGSPIRLLDFDVSNNCNVGTAHANDTVVEAATNVRVRIGDINRATVTSDGFAVTGTMSATGDISTTGAVIASGAVVAGGMVDAQTPNNSSDGGVRIRGNVATGMAYLQFTDATAAQWGYFSCNETGLLTWGGNTLWHAGNDGSGSGMDADLLDGQHGAWYTDIVARLGFTPFDKAGGNITGPTSVDGDFAVFGNIEMAESLPIIQMNVGGPRIESPAANTLRIGNSPIYTQFEIQPAGNLYLFGKRGIDAGVSGSGSVIVTADSPSGYALGTWSDADYTAIQFVRGVLQTGTITCTASATHYGTTSDYRAKTIVGPASGAVERILGLNLYDLVFNNDPDRRVVCGLLAHEAAEIFPQAIQGKKDAVDDEGGIVFQQADYSKFIPDILSALQQALLRIGALEKAA